MSLSNTRSPTSQELLLSSPPPLPRGVFSRRPPRPHISQHRSPNQQVPFSQGPRLSSSTVVLTLQRSLAVPSPLAPRGTRQPQPHGPGSAQPLAGRPRAAPLLNGSEYFKAYSAFIFDSGLLCTLQYKGFYLFPLLQCLFPKLFLIVGFWQSVSPAVGTTYTAQSKHLQDKHPSHPRLVLTPWSLPLPPLEQFSTT